MQSTGLVLISIGIIIYGIIPLKPDLGSTHALNPQWPAHARFHVVSQVMTNFFIAILSMVLVWSSSTGNIVYLNLSVILSFFVIGGFFLSLVFWRIYKGKLRNKKEEDSHPRKTMKSLPEINTLVFGSAGILILTGRILLIF